MMYTIAYYSVKHKIIIPIPVPIKNNVPIDIWEQAWDIFNNLKKSDQSYLIICEFGNINIFPNQKPKLKEVYNLFVDLNTLKDSEITKKFYNSGWYIKPIPKPINQISHNQMPIMVQPNQMPIMIHPMFLHQRLGYYNGYW